MIKAAVLSAFTTLLPLGCGVVFWRKLKKPLHVLLVFCLASLLCDSVGITLAIGAHSNVLITSLFSLAQLSLLGTYFAFLLPEKSSQRIALALLFVIFIGLFSYTYIVHSYEDYISAFRSLGVSNIVLIVLCLNFFYITLRRLEYERIETNPYFWIACGILLHSTSCFTLALTPDLVSTRVYGILWIYFKNIMQGLMNILLVVGILLAVRNSSA